MCKTFRNEFYRDNHDQDFIHHFIRPKGSFSLKQLIDENLWFSRGAVVSFRRHVRIFCKLFFLLFDDFVPELDQTSLDMFFLQCEELCLSEDPIDLIEWIWLPFGEDLQGPEKCNVSWLFIWNAESLTSQCLLAFHRFFHFVRRPSPPWTWPKCCSSSADPKMFSNRMLIRQRVHQNVPCTL